MDLADIRYFNYKYFVKLKIEKPGQQDSGGGDPSFPTLTKNNC